MTDIGGKDLNNPPQKEVPRKQSGGVPTRKQSGGVPPLATAALRKAEADRTIRRIMEEETRASAKNGKKPPFPYGKHLYWTFLSGGLWLPVWVFLSLRHDYLWQRAEKTRGRPPSDS